MIQPLRTAIARRIPPVTVDPAGAPVNDAGQQTVAYHEASDLARGQAPGAETRQPDEPEGMPRM